MTVEIYPLTSADLPALSRFLTTGFHAPADAGFASPEVLRWKYLEEGQDKSPDVPLSYLAIDESGAIVGHVGISRTAFVGRGVVGGRVETLHLIDWLGSREHRSVGTSLMRRAHAVASMQFCLGATEAARAVLGRIGYDLVCGIPVYQKVLRSGYWLRAGGLSTAAQRWPRLAREVARRGLGLVTNRRPGSAGAVELRPVSSFGDEVLSIAEAAGAHAVLTDRSPDRLNAFLRFPGQEMTGWHLLRDGRIAGFAILNLVPQDGGKTRLGKVVDCLLEMTDVAPWHGAVDALTRELERRGVDLVQVYAGTPWLAEGLKRAGFGSRFAPEFRLRDRDGLIPRDGPFHIMPIEADYAYT